MNQTFIEYMKLHLISLRQDLDPLDKSDNEILFIQGQMKATEHLLSVAHDMMSS